MAQSQQALAQPALAQPALPLLVALRVPLAAGGDRWRFEKAGLRAAFTPSRLTLAMCAGEGDGPTIRWRVAVTGATLPARRLPTVEALLDRAMTAPRGQHEPDGGPAAARGRPQSSQTQQPSSQMSPQVQQMPPRALFDACANDLPQAGALARLAARLIAHHHRALT
ncbi:MAG TPA: hypothetical protein PKA20_30085 [Burkholderiaceae bacterium]|nr:hypothetical protein [Burkholderiaceae bacterium]